jgi:DNA-binding CsgD family transcriptional regulator
MTGGRKSAVRNVAFTGDETRKFSALLLRVRRIVHLERRLEALEMQRAALAAVFDRMSDGVVILDGGGAVVFANRTAAALLAESDGLACDRDGIAAAEPGGNTTLQRLIAGARNGSSRHGMGDRCSLGRRNGRAPLSVLVAPLRVAPVRSAVSWIAPCRPAAALFVTDPDRGGSLRAETLGRRFDLTRAETAFVVEVVKGDGLQAAADRLGIALATARTHLRHVFDKTGTRHQAELVGLAMNQHAMWREDV